VPGAGLAAVTLCLRYGVSGEVYSRIARIAPLRLRCDKPGHRIRLCSAPDQVQDPEIGKGETADQEKFQVDPVLKKRDRKDNYQQDGKQDGGCGNNLSEAG